LPGNAVAAWYQVEQGKTVEDDSALRLCLTAFYARELLRWQSSFSGKATTEVSALEQTLIERFVSPVRIDSVCICKKARIRP
jgi:hypothetical protein